MDPHDVLNELAAELFAIKAPDGAPIEFRLKPNQHAYLYYTGPRGEMHCYTPHPDTRGWCWVWTYQPVGKGSRSGKPRQWRMSGLERVGHPRTAKRAALLNLCEAKARQGV